MSLRVVVADDQAMVRAGFRSLLNDEPDSRSSARRPTASRPSPPSGASGPTWR